MIKRRDERARLYAGLRQVFEHFVIQISHSDSI
jgi:hypothetical protein